MNRLMRLIAIGGLLLCGGGAAPAADAPKTRAVERPAAPLPPEPPSMATAPDALPLLQSSGEIEQAIQQLAEPIDEAQVTHLLSSISALSDPAAQERLQQLLNERVRQVMEAADNATKTPADQLSPDAPDDILKQRIQDLKLGPDATAEDLRHRDTVVSAIVGIADPVRREQFLHLLAQRERDAETPSAPAADGGPDHLTAP